MLLLCMPVGSFIVFRVKFRKVPEKSGNGMLFICRRTNLLYGNDDNNTWCVCVYLCVFIEL